uniref:WLM domain-containing protein n=1 Tax=Ditylum brightwellii TaxID=49249 RepID=A0A7S2ECK9_9STRA|mmetsp:Transcript_23778/g.35499  ORF Transcript_23778/g.35499 Transcript_23778/m.35499 type:complete len:414 (+) Transcript_23778:45-1286(+)
MEANHSDDVNTTPTTTLIISFRGEKVEISLDLDTTIGDVKSILLSSVDDSLCMMPGDVKILHKGKVLMTPEGITNECRNEDDVNMRELLLHFSQKKSKTTKTTSKATTLPKIIRLIATGVSSSEVEASDRDMEKGISMASKQVRDDITEMGKIKEARRKRRGRDMLRKAATAQGGRGGGGGETSSGFGKIETLPNLPNEKKARDILETLANDRGVLACMAKHRWNVGCLAELYPEGKVGETDVCVMGLNQNKGQKILLRIRTDDLKGFRKMLSIRKVLFHELAHNVHSEHDEQFFQLMRQIERECNDLDWTRSQGNTIGSGGVGSSYADDHELNSDCLYQGGTYRLGGDSNESENRHHMPVRELAARAAMMRLTAEEEEIQKHCGCGHGRRNISDTVGGEKESSSKEDDKNGK